MNEPLFKIYTQETAPKVIVVLQYYKDNMERLKPLLSAKFGLTKTESEVAIGIMYGYSHEAYEQIFGIKAATTKKHLSHVYGKMGVGGKGRSDKAKLVSVLHHYKERFDIKRYFD